VPMGRAYHGSQAGPVRVLGPPGLSDSGHKNRRGCPHSVGATVAADFSGCRRRGGSGTAARATQRRGEPNLEQ
jgi:hypothetical protein